MKVNSTFTKLNSPLEVLKKCASYCSEHLLVGCCFQLTSETLKQFSAVSLSLDRTENIKLHISTNLQCCNVKIETHKHTEESQNIVLKMLSQMEITGETCKEEFSLIYVT